MAADVPPHILRALRDPRLRRRTVYVYVLAYLELTDTEYRPLKVRWFAKVHGLNWRRSYADLDRLVRAGYLDRAPRDPSRGTRAYRLVLFPSSPNP